MAKGKNKAKVKADKIEDLDLIDETMDSGEEKSTPVAAATVEGKVIVNYKKAHNTFNVYDEDSRTCVTMVLKLGQNRVSASLFSMFEQDEFFKTKILGGKDPVAYVISRPESSKEVEI
jgi:hypothetical protein